MKLKIQKSIIVIYCFLAATIIISLISGSSYVIDNLNYVIITFMSLGLVIIISDFKEFIFQFKTFKTTDTIVLVIVSILLGITMILWDDNLFGIITTITGILCVIQAARGSKWTFFWGAYNVLFYAIIAYMNAYAGDFVLNAFFNLPMQMVGIYFWSKHYNSDIDIVIKRRFRTIDYAITAGLILVGTFIVGEIMPIVNGLLKMGENQLPFIDAFTTMASIMAQILLTRRYREQWLIWILINIFTIIMWITIGDIPMVIMWSAYLVNAIFGYIKWSE